MQTIKEIGAKFYLEILATIDIFVESMINDISQKTDNQSELDLTEKVKVLQQKNLSELELAALKMMVKGKMTGVIHSLLVTIDGGTALSDSGQALELINRKTNQPLSAGALHENFIKMLQVKNLMANASK